MLAFVNSEEKKATTTATITIILFTGYPLTRNIQATAKTLKIVKNHPQPLIYVHPY